MTHELAHDLRAVCMMGGAIIWVEASRLEKLNIVFSLPRDQWPQFIEVDGQMINPSRVEGMFTAAVMEDMERRKNGQWKCSKRGMWHDRGQKCECREVIGMQKGMVNGSPIEYPIYGK